MNIEAMHELIRVLKAVPPEHFNMADVARLEGPPGVTPTRPEQLHTCGSAACALGYAALDPWFQQRGLHLQGNSHRRLHIDQEVAADILGLDKWQLDLIFIAEHPLVDDLSIGSIKPAQMVEVIEAMIAEHLAQEAT